MTAEHRGEGRLHYFDGHFVETDSADAPTGYAGSDPAALEKMEQAAGRSLADLTSAAYEAKYAMAHYVVDGRTARIAIKDLTADGDEGPLDPEVREAAEQRFREWAEGLGLDPEFVPYGRF